jgi:hypothetical protein
MEFTDYMLWKAIAILIAAFAWGVYCGFTGRPLWPEHHDETEKPPE